MILCLATPRQDYISTHSTSPLSTRNGVGVLSLVCSCQLRSQENLICQEYKMIEPTPPQYILIQHRVHPLYSKGRTSCCIYTICIGVHTSKYQHKIEHLHRKRKIVRESRKVLHILHFFHFDFPFSFSLHFCHITSDIQQLAVKGQQGETSPYNPPVGFNDFS